MSTEMFHVFIRTKSSDSDRVLFLDLSERELRAKFVDQYLDGKDIFDRGSITRIAEISKVTVLKSDLSAQDTMKKMAADHQAELERIKQEEGLNVLGSYRGRNMSELIGYCDDVTEKMIARAPGTGTTKSKIVKFLHNPWVVRVGGGGLLLLLGVVIGKLWGNG